LGDFALDKETVAMTVAPLTLWFLFMFCTILNMIVMFNLLIAIISETFAKVNNESEQNSNQERAKIIAENTFLIPTFRQEEISDKERYIVVARRLDDVVDNTDIFQQRLTLLSKMVNTRIDALDKSMQLKMAEILEAVKK
jgi:uncharacterized membrane protein